MRTIHPTPIAAAIALSIFIAGCGSKEAEQQASTTEAPAVEEESGADPREKDYLEACELKMSLPEPRQWKTFWDPRGRALLGEGPSTVHSTYWAEGEVREKLIATNAPPLEVSCSFENADGENEIMLSMEARGQLEEADVPYGPGTYPIVPRSQDAGAPKGFWVSPLLYGTSMFEATGGSLTITRFDDKGVAGSFYFDAKEQVVGERSMVIEGKFDMPCRGEQAETKCAAGKAILE